MQDCSIGLFLTSCAGFITTLQYQLSSEFLFHNTIIGTLTPPARALRTQLREVTQEQSSHGEVLYALQEATLLFSEDKTETIISFERNCLKKKIEKNGQL